MCFIIYLSSILPLLGWHNMPLHTDYQLRLMMWVRQMAQRGRPEMHIFLYGNPKERDHLLGLDICRRMALTFMSCLSRPWFLNWCCGYLCNTYTAVRGFTRHSTAGNVPNKLCLIYLVNEMCYGPQDTKDPLRRIK